jgi:hypothetical protein
LNNSLQRLKRKKTDHTQILLGYSELELKTYIESKWTDGMSWDNYGEWHIDHIDSLSSFSVDTSLKIVNALSNLRPLWATTRKINDVLYQGNLNRGKQLEKTIITDLDGTLCEHNPLVIRGKLEMKLLPGTLEKLLEWRSRFYTIILITGRKEKHRAVTIQQLTKARIPYDELIMGLGRGKRIVINDIKPDGTLTAVAYNLERNQGISSINE